MSGKPIDQGFLKRILGSAFKKAGGTVEPKLNTQVDHPVPPKDRGRGRETRRYTVGTPRGKVEVGDPRTARWSDIGGGMSSFLPDPEAQRDPYFTELLLEGQNGYEPEWGTTTTTSSYFDRSEQRPGYASSQEDLDWDPEFMSRWGTVDERTGLQDFGQGTLKDPLAPERRRAYWEGAMLLRDRDVRKSARRRGRRDARDEARTAFGRSVLGDLYDPIQDTRRSISKFPSKTKQRISDFNPDARAGIYRLAGAGFDVGRAGLYGGARLGAKEAKALYQQALEMEQALERGAVAGAKLGVRGAKAGAKYGVIDPTRRAAGMVSAADAIALQGAQTLRKSGQALGTATRGSGYLGLQQSGFHGTLPQSTGALNGVMRGLAGLFILFVFISVFYMVFGPVYDVLITNFLSIAGADGSTMLGGKDIATLYANTANSILIWVPLITIGGTLYLLISMVFERESKGMARTNEMLQWDALSGMDEDMNLDIALDGGMDDAMGLYGPS
tara:strand:- start:377 stop:1876 length:1500 start_codon:yes stop_codon:yes gene_type:complete